MKLNSIFFYIPMLVILACSNINNRTHRVETGDSKKVTYGHKEDFSKEQMQINQIVKGKVFMVKDPSKYAPKFLTDLLDLYPEYDTLILKEDKIIIMSRSFNGVKYVTQQDTTIIPSGLPLNIFVKYKAEIENKKYELSLKRINYTNIEYDLKINDASIRTGQAILPGGFILGEETDEDENGSAYSVIQYLDDSDCWTSIRIEKDSRVRASFKLLCERDKTKETIDIPLLKKE
jgi:hypothetical protein